MRGGGRVALVLAMPTLRPSASRVRVSVPLVPVRWRLPYAQLASCCQRRAWASSAASAAAEEASPQQVAPSEKLTLHSGSAVHNRPGVGGQDAALVADELHTVGVFDAVGGWFGTTTNFAYALKRTVYQLLTQTDSIKHGALHFG